jgi:hypothetical protein
MRGYAVAQLIEALCHKPEGHGFETQWGKCIFSIYLILPAILGPGVYSVSNRNKYQEQNKKSFWGVECSRHVRLKTSPPSVSRMSRQCGILNISQPYRTPQPVKGIAFFFLLFQTTIMVENKYDNLVIRITNLGYLLLITEWNMKLNIMITPFIYKWGTGVKAQYNLLH